MKKLFKSVLAIMLAVIMTLGAAPLAGLVGLELPGIFDVKAEAATDGYYTYSVSNGEAGITDVDTSISGDIVIPSTLGGYPVTIIYSAAFYKCTSLESITIPDSVTIIGNWVFENCTSLESITIPDGVTSIGMRTFSGCTSLESITIPDSVTNIGNYAFYNCDSLESVTIPDNVTSIGESAFRGCTSLESVTIPDNVTSIGEGAFFDCSGITKITVDPANPAYSSDKDGVLYNKDKTELIQYPAGNTIKSYTVPDDVTVIGYGAFRSCKNLTSVTIPDSVTKIGELAFSFSRKLASVTIPETVTKIESGTFHECTALKDVYYGGSKAEWEEIKIGGSNDPIFYLARIHYNSDGSSDNGSSDIPDNTPDYDSSVVDNYLMPTPTETTISYGDSIILHVDPSKIPEGGYVEWYPSNGNFSYSASADGTTCTITPSKSGDTTFTAIVYDAEGNIVSADEQTMTSKAGFFDKLIAFFKKLFGLTKTIPQVSET